MLDNQNPSVVAYKISHAEASMVEVRDGALDVLMPADSFVSIITTAE